MSEGLRVHRNVNSHPDYEGEDESVAGIVTFDGAKFVLQVASPVRRQRYMVEVEPEAT